jgi:hypothetical protein
MSGKNQTIDWSQFTNQWAAVDLLKNSIGKSIEYNYYNNRNTFKVLALSPSIPLSTLDAAALPGGTTGGAGDVSKYIIKGRIIDDNSPHSWIPDPCAWSKGDAQDVMDLIMAHTTFLVYGDPKASMRVPVKPGDIFLAQMEPDNNSYNLQYGRFLEILNRTGMDRPYNRSQKACNKSLKSKFPTFPEFGEGLGVGPKGATYNGSKGVIPIKNGRLPAEIMGQADTTYSTGGMFLVDLLPSFNALAKAYFEKFNGKKLQLNGTYRTYERAKKICGAIMANGRCTNGLSSLPGSSRHGWAAAFDWQLTISWINEHGHKTTAARRHQFNCPHWRWMWANAHLHPDENGVFWTSPAWARPACGENTKKTGASLATEEQLTSMGTEFCGEGGLLEAWHWEPSNFNQLITGIGK